MQDPDTLAWTGFEVDLLEEIKKGMATCEDVHYSTDGTYGKKGGDSFRECRTVELEYVQVDNEAIWLEPSQGTCDIVAGAIPVLPEIRESGGLFSWYDYYASLSYISTNTTDTLLEVCDRGSNVIGYLSTRLPEETLQGLEEAGCILKAYPPNKDGLDEMLRDIDIDSIAGAIVNTATANYLASLPEGDQLFVTDSLVDGGPYGFVGARSEAGLAVMKYINNQLCHLYHNGVYNAIYFKWFGIDNEPPPPPLPCDYSSLRETLTAKTNANAARKRSATATAFHSSPYSRGYDADAGNQRGHDGGNKHAPYPSTNHRQGYFGHGPSIGYHRNYDHPKDNYQKQY